MIRLSIFFGVLFCLIAAGIFYFFRMKSLQISEVAIVGTERIDAAVLHNEASSLLGGTIFYLVPKTFFLAYPRKEIVSNILSRYQEVNSVDVKLKGFNKIEIDVRERQPVAYYCAETCYVSDENGFVFEDAASSTESYVVFRDTRVSSSSPSMLGTYPLPTDIFKTIESFAKRLPNLGLHLGEIIIEERGDISILTGEGQLIISTLEPLDPQYEFLQLALSQKVFKNDDGSIKNFSYIDLRFGKKVFYRL